MHAARWSSPAQPQGAAFLLEARLDAHVGGAAILAVGNGLDLELGSCAREHALDPQAEAQAGQCDVLFHRQG